MVYEYLLVFCLLMIVAILLTCCCKNIFSHFNNLNEQLKTFLTNTRLGQSLLNCKENSEITKESEHNSRTRVGILDIKSQ